MPGRTLTNLVSVVATLTVMTTASGLVTAQRINVCHETSAGKYELIQVSEGGADGHLARNGASHAGHEMDFISTTGNCEAEPTPTPTPDAVPEPITVLLFGTGVAGIGYLSRRHRKGRRWQTAAE